MSLLSSIIKEKLISYIHSFYEITVLYIIMNSGILSNFLGFLSKTALNINILAIVPNC